MLIIGTNQVIMIMIISNESTGHAIRHELKDERLSYRTFNEFQGPMTQTSTDQRVG